MMFIKFLNYILILICLYRCYAIESDSLTTLISDDDIESEELCVVRASDKKDSQQSYNYMNGRIVGGEEAYPHQFPWQV